MIKRTVSKVIDKGSYSYLVLHDPCHGPKANRYTVYKIDRHPGHKKSGRTKIIGREVPWCFALRMIDKQPTEKLLW